MSKGAEGNKQLGKTTVEHIVSLDGITQEQKDRLLLFYKTKASKFSMASELGTSIVLKDTDEQIPGVQATPSYYPELVDDLNGKLFCILEPEAYLPESAAFLTLLFCFGMLARYYPDLWMKILQINVPFVAESDLGSDDWR